MDDILEINDENYSIYENNYKNSFINKSNLYYFTILKKDRNNLVHNVISEEISKNIKNVLSK